MASRFVATGIHRLWKAGKGWTMARDLKPGDILRTLGGTAAVKSVVRGEGPAGLQPPGRRRRELLRGRSGVLAHDNSTINPTPEPFDAVGGLVDSEPGPVAIRPRPLNDGDSKESESCSRSWLSASV